MGQEHAAVPGDEEDELPPFTERLDTEVYVRKLLESKHGVEEKIKPRRPPKPVIPGADYLASIPHAPWASRAMLKRRIVLGSKPMVVKNGVTRIVYPSGAMYEGHVLEGEHRGTFPAASDVISDPPPPPSRRKTTWTRNLYMGGGG